MSGKRTFGEKVLGSKCVLDADSFSSGIVTSVPGFQKCEIASLGGYPLHSLVINDNNRIFAVAWNRQQLLRKHKTFDPMLNAYRQRVEALGCGYPTMFLVGMQRTNREYSRIKEYFVSSEYEINSPFRDVSTFDVFATVLGFPGVSERILDVWNDDTARITPSGVLRAYRMIRESEYISSLPFASCIVSKFLFYEGCPCAICNHGLMSFCGGFGHQPTESENFYYTAKTRGIPKKSDNHPAYPIENSFDPDSPPLVVWRKGHESKVFTDADFVEIEKSLKIKKKDYFVVSHNDVDFEDHAHIIFYPKHVSFKIYVKGLTTNVLVVNHIQIDLLIRLMHLVRKFYNSLKKSQTCLMDSPFQLPNGDDYMIGVYSIHATGTFEYNCLQQALDAYLVMGLICGLTLDFRACIADYLRENDKKYSLVDIEDLGFVLNNLHRITAQCPNEWSIAIRSVSVVPGVAKHIPVYHKMVELYGINLARINDHVMIINDPHDKVGVWKWSSRSSHGRYSYFGNRMDQSAVFNLKTKYSIDFRTLMIYGGDLRLGSKDSWVNLSQISVAVEGLNLESSLVSPSSSGVSTPKGIRMSPCAVQKTETERIHSYKISEVSAELFTPPLKNDLVRCFSIIGDNFVFGFDQDQNPTWFDCPRYLVMGFYRLHLLGIEGEDLEVGITYAFPDHAIMLPRISEQVPVLEKLLQATTKLYNLFLRHGVMRNNRTGLKMAVFDGRSKPIADC